LASRLTWLTNEADIDSFSTKLDTYNEKLSSIDSLQNEMDSLELKLREKNTRILSAAASHYGPDSTEYEQAGGTRRSERKRTGAKGPRTSTATSGAKPT
jgi:hypothetical protein